MGGVDIKSYPKIDTTFYTFNKRIKHLSKDEALDFVLIIYDKLKCVVYIIQVYYYTLSVYNLVKVRWIL